MLRVAMEEDFSVVGEAEIAEFVSAPLAGHMVASIDFVDWYLALRTRLRSGTDHFRRRSLIRCDLQATLSHLRAGLVFVPGDFADDTVLMTTSLTREDGFCDTTWMKLSSIASSRKTVPEIGICSNGSAEACLIVLFELSRVEDGLDLAVGEDFATLRTGNLVPGFLGDLVGHPRFVACAAGVVAVLVRGHASRAGELVCC